MKRAPVLLIVTAVTFAAAAGGHAWLMSRYLPGYSVGQILLDLGPVEKLLVIMVVLMTGLTVLVGGVGLLARGSATGIGMLLGLTAVASAALGLLAFLYTWMTIQTAIRAIGPVSFEVTAPSYAEALLVLSIGLFGALIALGLRALLTRRG